MKIAYVAMQFPVASEAFAAVEIRALRRLGADVSVLTYRGAPAGAEAMQVERGLGDLTVDHGGGAASLKGLALACRRPADALWLVAAILRHCWQRPGQLLKALALVPRSVGLLAAVERTRPEVVHLFWGHFPSLLGLLVRRRLPGVVVSQFLGAYDLEEAFPLSAVLAAGADLRITHARANLPQLARLGVDPAAVAVTYRGVEIPAPLPAPAKTPGLMVVAERLVPQKRTADALRLFAEVAKTHPQVRLEVLGDGPEVQPLQALAGQLGIAGRVRFAGHVPHREVFNRLAAAEVALTMSQSRSDRLPNALKEAMLHRCVCLTSRSSGIEELISDGETGLLADFGDIAGAARRLGALLDEPAKLARIGQRAQDRIVADFDVDRLMAERLQQWTALRQDRKAGEAA